ncbi:intracellular protein transport protein USO1 isoform X2 [Teleopsis dalmanni]|uniref:intracellular protein transport protein USO1 isoform X2 n=1 Tax=Teleopsis dalmanni TaxID=139649 RepID=UPI0018CD6302|nr:intracellular protein transport protein USO1 isoform X2 [Teleopsis dalmanni]
MNTPGLSIFQGGDTMKVNTTLERQEEEEALEDQRRRNVELGNLLQNAFDDLEDCESTVDSTCNYQSDIIDTNKAIQHHDNLHFAAQNNNNNIDHQTCEAQIYRLKTMLESKTHEVENINKIANEEIKKCDEMQKRLIITEAELSHSLSAKESTYELLVESKEKCSNLENTIEKIKSEKRSLENENQALLGKLETSQAILSDLQQKFDMVERDVFRKHDRSAEQRRKQWEERQRAENELILQQMEQLKSKLEKKSNDLECMTTRYNALQSSNEAMLVDKASKINDLTNALSEAQRKCEELLTKPDYLQENIRLQKLVTNLEDQIQSMEKTIGTLRERLDFTSAELDVMDSVLQQHNLEDSMHNRLSPTRMKTISTPLTTMDRVQNLKDELYRALSNVKSKREEIRRLTKCLEDKNAELDKYRTKENAALVEITTLKEQRCKLHNQVLMLEEECKQLASSSLDKTYNNTKIKELNQELLQLKEEKMCLTQQHNELERVRSNNEKERQKLDAKLKNVQVDLEELKQEYDSLKANYELLVAENKKLHTRAIADNALQLELEKQKFLLKDAQSECDRLKKLYLEIANSKDELSFEVEKMRKMNSAKELNEEREKTASLQKALQLTEMKSSELAKILETEKVCHEREMKALKQKIEKELTNRFKSAKESSNNCTKCIDLMTEVTKHEIANLKLTSTNSEKNEEIIKLNAELENTKILVAELTEKMKLSEQQEILIKELKTKAQKFEDYIKSHSSSSEHSTTKEHVSSDKSVSTTPELMKNEVQKIESRIREEMAKIFAVEIKRVQLKLQQNEEKCLCLQREYQHVLNNLQQSQNEVELLKHAILTEREETVKHISQKDEAIKELEKKQKTLLKSIREELNHKNKEIDNATSELHKRQSQIEAERQSMKLVMAQWEAHRDKANAEEINWKKKFEDLKHDFEEATGILQKNYNSAKRTINNYKRYNEDKDEFYKSELVRLKNEYTDKLAKEKQIQQSQ